MKSTYWKAPRPELLPDFIIGGAMKSGTSSLHAILDRHPEVFIPKEEIGFFDIDHLPTHYDFNFYDRKAKTWISQDMSADASTIWSWYQDKFLPGVGKVKGEDSTSYLSAPWAAQRIGIQEKPIKLIFMLRQPSLRAYSNYFHLVRSGVMGYSFEDALQFLPQLVLGRSSYTQQLAQVFDHIPKERVHLVLFEEFVSDPKKVVTEVCEFLGLAPDVLKEEDFEIHSNQARFPIIPRWYRLKNFFYRRYGNSFYTKSLPNKASDSVNRRFWWPKVVNRVHGIFNPLRPGKTPPMQPDTRIFLDQYFEKDLEGLDELVGREVYKWWFAEK